MTREPKAAPAPEGVASAERTLALLSAFRKGDRTLTLAELSARTGLVKSTILRIAVSLESHGYLARSPEGEFRLDAELLRLGTIYQESFRLDAHVLPVLEHVVAQTGESASFYIRRDDMRLCLFRVDSPHRLRLHVRQGDMLPMDDSAIAQVLRIFTTEPLPPEAATLDFPLYTNGVSDPHVAGMATPVFGPEDQFAGALTLSGPLTRLTPEAARLAAPILRDAATALTRSLGGRMPAAPIPPHPATGQHARKGGS